MGMTRAEHRRWQEEHSIGSAGEEEIPAPTRSTPPGGFQPSTGRGPAEPIYTDPWDTPVNAGELGGATEVPGEDITEYGPDMKPRNVPRAPGPQSLGELLQGGGADTLVKAVRNERLARTVTKTFGELAAGERLSQEQDEAAAAEQQAQQAEIAASIKFLVDARTGEFEPVMPDQETPAPGPYDVLVSTGKDPGSPIIHARGSKVTKKMIDNMASPDTEPMQPTLREGYKVPEQYAGIAEALGVKT